MEENVETVEMVIKEMSSVPDSAPVGYKCEVPGCKYVGPRLRALKCHQTKKHGPKISCPLRKINHCNYFSGKSLRMQEHMERRHPEYKLQVGGQLELEAAEALLPPEVGSGVSMNSPALVMESSPSVPLLSEAGGATTVGTTSSIANISLPVESISDPRHSLSTYQLSPTPDFTFKLVKLPGMEGKKETVMTLQWECKPPGNAPRRCVFYSNPVAGHPNLVCGFGPKFKFLHRWPRVSLDTALQIVANVCK